MKRGAATTDGAVSPQSADHANSGELVGKGLAQIGRTSVERFAIFLGGGDTWRVRVLLPSMTTSIIRPAF